MTLFPNKVNSLELEVRRWTIFWVTQFNPNRANEKNDCNQNFLGELGVRVIATLQRQP